MNRGMADWQAQYPTFFKEIKDFFNKKSKEMFVYLSN